MHYQKLFGGNILRAINRAIDKFSLKHPRFGIPGLMKYIVFISAAVFIIGHASDGDFFLFLIFSPGDILNGQIWRLVTWVFLPYHDGIIFTAIALYFYFFVGSTLEREWGTPKFTIFYLFGVLLNIIYGFLVAAIISFALFDSLVEFMVLLARVFLLNPFFLNLSMLFAFAVLFPEHKIMLFLIIPIKVKWLGLLNALFFAYEIITRLSVGSQASIITAFLPIVAILNFIIFCGYDLMLLVRPQKVRYLGNTINFKRASRKAKRDTANKPYRHKCAVCGKTDAEYPELEFRYCSRCNGYHCFCLEHINNHIHFQ